MSDYIPDPIELMEMRAERMIDEHMPASRPDEFLCACCKQWRLQADGMEQMAIDPSSPPICMSCFTIFANGCGP